MAQWKRRFLEEYSRGIPRVGMYVKDAIETVGTLQTSDEELVTTSGPLNSQRPSLPLWVRPGPQPGSCSFRPQMNLSARADILKTW